MAERGNYWTRGRVSRRTMLRGASVAGAGLAGAALIGCGGDDDPTATPGAGGGGGGATATPGGGGGGGGGVPADQVRLTPGIYEGHVGPSAAEADPANNAKYGGTLVTRYLEPPRMDMNRTLSCTIYHTLNFTNNKLLRGKTGANADPDIVEIEPDLAESWEAVTDDSTEFVFNLREGGDDA